MLNYQVNQKAFEHHSCSSTPNSRILWSGVHPRGPSDPSGRTGHKQVVFRWPQETFGKRAKLSRVLILSWHQWIGLRETFFQGNYGLSPIGSKNAPVQIIQLGKSKIPDLRSCLKWKHVISWLMVSIICRQFKSFLRSLKIISRCVHASFNSGCWNLPPGISLKK